MSTQANTSCTLSFKEGDKTIANIVHCSLVPSGEVWPGYETKYIGGVKISAKWRKYQKTCVFL